MLLIIQEFDLVSQDRHLDPKKTIQFNFEKKKFNFEKKSWSNNFSLWTIKGNAPLTANNVLSRILFSPCFAF